MNDMNQKAAIQLLKNRQAGAPKIRLSAELRPQSSEQALQIQTEMIKQRDDNVAGWKCSLPLNEEQLIVAPIFHDTVQTGDHCSLFSDNGKARVEPEIAFILATDLPAKEAGYSEKEIDDAVQGCFMALELMQDRIVNEKEISFYEKLADCLVNQGLYIGPEINKHDAYLSSEFSIKVDQENTQQCFNGKHPNQLPQKPLYWLINFMSKRGVSFKAGQAIITGSYAGVVEIEFNSVTHINYSGLGSYHVTFNDCA